MTWWIWLFVVFCGAVLFGLGCVQARAGMVKRGTDKLIANSRVNSILAIFFTVIALVAAIDTIHLQIQFNKYVKDQVNCNTKLLRASRIIYNERANLDRIAAEFNIAFTNYIAVQPVPADNPAYVNLQKATKDLITGQLIMVRVYADNPLIEC